MGAERAQHASGELMSFHGPLEQSASTPAVVSTSQVEEKR